MTHPDDATADAPPGARDQPTLADLLMREPWRYEFVQVVRLLERLAPDRAPIGGDAAPADEAARCRAHVSLAFPASQVQDLSVPPEAGRPLEVTVNVMGLAGPLGVLPSHYTALLSDPSLRKQTAPLRDFLDLFNHRLISLFYRAWEKFRFPVAYERQADGAFSHYLFCLIGMGTAGLRNRLRISDQILLHYAGLLAERPRTAVVLESLLQDYFGVPVEVEQFSGEWFLMNADALTGLGVPGQNSRLGVDTVLWERIWDPQARFRIRVGPLSWKEFQDFLPPSEAYRHLVELTRFFVGEEFSFEVQPVLRASEVPPPTLGAVPQARLGWATWLANEGMADDASHAVFAARVAHLDA